MKWTKQKNDQVPTFALSGAVDEKAEPDLQALETAIGGAASCVLDLSKTTHFNSIGLGAWSRFSGRLTKKTKLQLEGCPMPFTRFLSMLAGDSALRNTVLSVLVPFECGGCKKGFEQTTKRDALIAQGTGCTAACPSCKKSGTVAEAAEEDLGFFCDLLEGDQKARKPA